MPIGHELEIVNGFGGIDGIGADIKNHGLYKVRQMPLNGIGDIGQVMFSSPIPNYALAAIGLLGILYYGSKWLGVR